MTLGLKNGYKHALSFTKALENISLLTGMHSKLYTDADIIRKI